MRVCTNWGDGLFGLPWSSSRAIGGWFALGILGLRVFGDTYIELGSGFMGLRVISGSD